MSEAFIDVMVKNTQYDSYHIKSGYRLGQFVLDDPIPWDKNNLIVDKKGTKNARTKPYRIVPTGLVTTADDRAVIYSERLRLEKESLESIDTTQLEVVWHCEEAGLGPAVICVNFKFRLSNQWQQLTYSMKESPIRYYYNSHLCSTQFDRIFTMCIE